MNKCGRPAAVGGLVGGAFGVAVGLGPPHLRFIILWGVAGPMVFVKRRALSPVAPVYLNVTPQWLLEARRRPAEELLRLKWHGLLGTRAFGFVKEEFVWCLKDDACLGALIRGICAAVKDGRVKAKKAVLKRWLVFCVEYW